MPNLSSCSRTEQISKRCRLVRILDRKQMQRETNDSLSPIVDLLLRTSFSIITARIPGQNPISVPENVSLV